MNNINNNGSGLETQVTQVIQVTLVGYEFDAGTETDNQINQWLGNPSAAPRYCSDPRTSIEALERFAVAPIVLPTVPTGKPKRGEKFVQEFVAVFEKGGTIYSTVPFTQEAHAVAAVLWFVAGEDKSQVT